MAGSPTDPHAVQVGKPAADEAMADMQQDLAKSTRAAESDAERVAAQMLAQEGVSSSHHYAAANLQHGTYVSRLIVYNTCCGGV